MTVSFSAGQVLTADDLMTLAKFVITQGTDQTVTSSTTVANSSIVIAIDGLTEVDLSARWQSPTGGGGIRWAWSGDGTVSLVSRDIMSAGSAATTTNGTHNLDTMRWRQIATIGEEQTVVHFDGASTQLIRERLRVTGVGDLTFQFAQETSNSTGTVLHANSFATHQLLA